VTLEGRTADGQRLDSNEWQYAVKVCNGCLPIPACAAGEALTLVGCGNPGQDFGPVCVPITAP
jgi:hypothetical protein